VGNTLIEEIMTDALRHFMFSVAMLAILAAVVAAAHVK
jgi:hypothetical protein